MIDLSKISEDLFNKIRGRFPNVTIGDEEGNITNDPKLARFFDFEYKDSGAKLGKVSVNITDDKKLSVIFSRDFIEEEDETTKDNWYNFLKELRFFAKKRMFEFDVRDITKTNLTKRDYKFLSQTKFGDFGMNESKLYGTGKISYQNVDNARIVVKHTENIDQENPAARTRNIGSIYIESSEGERFKYPYRHLNGARAMARHVSEGGTPYDDFGNHITGLSEEMSKLKKFKTYMGRSSVMAESLAEYMDIVRERIVTVKKTIENLQKKSYYEETYNNFEKPVFEEVPDDVAENWIEQLTIRQFNEDLKDVFPYIYKLVSEYTRPKELGPDEVVSEEDEDKIDHKAPGVKKTKDGKYWAKNQSGTMKIFDKKSDAEKHAGATDESMPEEEEIERGFDEMMGNFREEGSGKENKKGEWQHGTKGMDKELDRLEKKKKDKKTKEDIVGEKPQTPLGEFILSYFDKNTGQFPKGETAVLTMVEKDYGEEFIEPAKMFIDQVNTRISEIMGYREETDDGMNTPYWQGYKAYGDGHFDDPNPYEEGSKEHKEWEEGYSHATIEANESSEGNLEEGDVVDFSSFAGQFSNGAETTFIDNGKIRKIRATGDIPRQYTIDGHPISFNDLKRYFGHVKLGKFRQIDPEQESTNDNLDRIKNLAGLMR